MRRALPIVACLALAACGSRPPPGGPAEDGGQPGDAQAGDARRDGAVPLDGPAASCTGPGSMSFNGSSIHAAVSGRMVFLNCCEAGELIFEPVASTVPRVVVMWRSQVGNPTAIPFTVDLAALPSSVGVQVLTGCGDPPEYCPNPTDTLSTGLTGTLTVEGQTGLGYVMTLCLHGVAPATEKHPVLRTIDLWAQDVVAPYPED